MEHKKSWKVECNLHMEKIYSKIIPVSNISEKNLKLLMNYLLSKYSLEDEEVANNYINIPFKKKTRQINIQRFNSMNNGNVHISFLADSAGYSVTATLIDSE
ncbi:hypothetical protein [Pedobacter gandavensis]|uniref:Uncharacterized protein n=1 Tax=Pedobacter gandavensis TaxID=2679963 RepID=A0ABR6EUH3_9SPHI|nr:hypothetical protein [Pedobacter gandavensis]MBB2148924.1 hypothetical protein [Pedobacter gandavensis]